jgi:MFS family permease
MIAKPARLCAFNAGVQVVWGAILAVSLQARSIALAGHDDAIRAYAGIAASGALVATLVQLGAGALSDRALERRGDRQAFYVVGVALAIPALFWFYLAPDLGSLIAAFLCLQVAMNVAGGPYQAIIPDYVSAGRRGVASSWMSAYQSLGNVLGLLIAGLVHDLRVVPALLAAPLAATYAATATHVRALARMAKPRLIDRPVAARPAVRIAGPLATLLISRGLINIGFFTLLGFLAFYVGESLGMAGPALEAQTGYLFITFTLAAVAGAVLSARPTDRSDKRAVVTVAVAIVIVGLALLATARGLPLAYAAGALAGIGWGAFVTADWALATALLPPEAMATAMGVWNVATTIPQVIAPLVTAPLVLRFNAVHPGDGPRAAIVLALVEFAAGAAFVWRLPRV